MLHLKTLRKFVVFFKIFNGLKKDHKKIKTCN